MSLLKRQNATDVAEAAALSADIDDDPRLGRLDQYLFGCMLFWAYLAVYGMLVGTRMAVPLFCVFSSCVAGFLLFLLKSRSVSRHGIANSFLFISLASLLCYCNLNPAGLSQAQFFFPVICLLASQLKGVSTAIRWYGLVIIVTFFSYYPVLSGVDQTLSGDQFGVFIFNMLLSFTMMWLAGEAEPVSYTHLTLPTNREV